MNVCMCVDEVGKYDSIFEVDDVFGFVVLCFSVGCIV